MECYIKIFLFVEFLHIAVSLDILGPIPRIDSEDGHLVITAGDFKNITFKTRKGHVNINGENILYWTGQAKLAVESLDRIVKSDGNSQITTVNRLTDSIEGPEGILKRLMLLENKANSSQPSVSFNAGPRIRIFNRRLSNLEVKVARVLNLLTKNECDSNPCKNGGVCQDLFNAFICHCPDTWEGSVCDIDVNECSRFVGTDKGCQNGATCINKPGTYECMCAGGWVGLHCSRRTQDCNTGSQQELCGKGICIPQNTHLGFTCLCDPGWKSNGMHPACTVDINECDSLKPMCSVNPNVTCINVPGTYYCGSCPQGYVGNGFHCTDVDECAINNGGCSVNPTVQCINTIGSRQCGACPPGYYGDGITCSYRGICRIENGGCHPMARCFENEHSNFVQCICPDGFQGNGMGPNGCMRSQVPSNVDMCLNNPCVYGTCVSHLTSYSCLCSPGYTGKYCNITIDPCSSNPCKNNGTCTVSETRTFSCYCTNAYTGRTCEDERQACGGRLTGETGFLDFPANNNTAYNHRVYCSWLIKTNETKVLKLKFLKFHLEKSPECVFDWLQIHDGKNSAAHRINRYCGSDLPNGGEIISSNNVLFLRFRSDDNIAKPGFKLKWTSIPPQCGEVKSITGHGVIKSPGYPGNYPNNRDCSWRLIAPLSKRIQLHFFTLMLKTNGDCNSDYLEIYYGLDINKDARLARYCNSSHPEPLITPDSRATIIFHSDGSGTDAGFQIAYSIIEGIPGCGGLYTRAKGEISSPTENLKYIPNMFCEYKIKVPEYSRIKITFLSFSMEQSVGCKFDYVAIQDGGKPDSDLIGRYCGNKLPASFTSTANELFIVFKSDPALNYGGFKLRYETVCGGSYTQPNGIIQSPGFPLKYYKNLDCIYLIEQPESKSIKIQFLDFDMEASPNCGFDFLEIRDGDNDNATRIGKYCGMKQLLPNEIISTHNYLWLHFKTDSSFLAKGFQLNYTTIDIKCGGIIKNMNGVIKSPQYPAKYPPNTKCRWILNAPVGYVIQLQWSNFHLEQSQTCVMDYVRIYDNNTNSQFGGLIGNYCGGTLPPVLISSSNIMTIIFSSDRSFSYDGFTAHYTFTDQSKVCGGHYYTSAGILQTPNFPNQYPRNKHCTWIITVPFGQQIMLNVTHFDLLNISSRHYLEIRNGGFETSPLLGKYSGITIPKTILSMTNNLYLNLVTDYSKSGTGFRMEWDGSTRGCGGNFKAVTGHIMTPNYPQSYGRNLQCIWKITTSAGSKLNILFLDLELEAHNRCLLDYVEIFNGLDYTSNMIGRYCNENHPVLITSQLNKVSIKFKSDATIHKRGFHLKYVTVCNNTLKGYRGVIESPNYPQNYPYDLNCLWTISVARGNQVNISFSHFNIQNTTYSKKECVGDYLKITEGGSPGDNIEDTEILRDKLCGSELPSLISSNQDTVHIQFKSDSIMTNSGFRLEWFIHGCGGVLQRPEGDLETPNYPNGYPRDTLCEWIIRVDFNNSVELTIIDSDLEKNSDCMFDYIKVFSGPNENAPLLTELCVTGKKNVVVTSSSSEMFVKFESDTSYHGRGFKAKYRTVASQCGGIFSSPLGSIHSRNYPKNYNNLDDCVWLIEIEEMRTIELIFHDLDIDFTANCTSDNLKIYDGGDDDAPLIKTLCGSAIPNDTIRSTTNKLFLRMQTDNRISAKGFLANYSTACGARIETDGSGMLNVQHLTLSSCSWTIISKSGNHVSLTLTHLDTSDYCFDKNLNVYDGEDTEAPLIYGLCGNKISHTVVSSGSAIHIDLAYTSDSSFSAMYSTISSECGGTLTSLNGYIASPGYPNNYPVNMECEWTIKTSPGNKLSLYFNVFELLNSDNCNSEHLEIREKNAMGKLLGVFCGTEIPQNISFVDSIWLQFRSGETEVSKGFLLEYLTEHFVELTGQSGQITSPTYPLVSSQTDEFRWRISVDLHALISVTFKDFLLEAFSNDYCFIPSLTIYDGYDDSAVVLAKLCGLSIPDPVISTSNVIYLTFESSSIRFGSKFFLEWMQVKRANTKENKSSSVKGCGSKEIIDVSGRERFKLKSPGYPLGYANELNCEWTFYTIPGTHLALEFIDVNLEPSNPNCLMDHVSVYSGIDGQPNWQLMRTVCLRNASSLEDIHTSNLMKVVFKTDSYINRTGFEAYVYTECGGSLFGPSGNISVKENNTFVTHKKLVCEWNITVKAGRTIQVKFLEFDIKVLNPPHCDLYILLRNGKYPDSPYLDKGIYCGNTIPVVNASAGNSISIKYVGTPLKKGFTLTYHEVSLACGGHILLTDDFNSTQISSPNFPNTPPPHTECIWIVSVPPGELVQVDFVERFDLSISYDCSKSGVELRDGGTKISPLIGIFCKKMPGTQKSEDNVMYIRYFADTSEPRNGFKAEISIAICGGVVRSNSGKLTSMSYPMSVTYPKNYVCNWQIEGKADHFLTLKFNDFNFPFKSNCSESERLEIRDTFTVRTDSLSPNLTSVSGGENLLGTFCGTKIPDDVKTISNKISIQLKTTDKPKPIKGFSLEYKSSQESCGKSINAESGEITSPGYPYSYHRNRYCIWRITVPVGRRITVTFLDYDLDDMTFLHDTGISLYNGPNYEVSIAHLLGPIKRLVYKSSSNKMSIYFWSMEHFSHRGFKLKFKSDEPTICTGDFNKDSGIIQAPTIFVPSYLCEWERNVGRINETVSITINTIQMPKRIEIRCKSALSFISIVAEKKMDLGYFCKYSADPSIVRSIYPQTTIKVLQSRFKSRINYTISYKVHPCGGIITSPEGFIASPPRTNTSQAIECAWLIKLGEGQIIKIYNISLDLDSICENNFLAIHNGASSSSPKIGMYCDKSQPDPLYSQSNNLWIEYSNSADSKGTGFNLSYTYVTNGCGGIFHDKSRTFESPNFPDKYPNNIECVWEVHAIEGYHIGLYFVERFQLEDSVNCTNDFIEVWDYVDDGWISLGRTCGRTFKTFNSTTNKMRIMFRSNANLTGNGFKATWKLNCGGSFLAEERVKYITSPGYPQEYYKNLNCEYKIHAPDKFINIRFDDFSLEDDVTCKYDNVTIYREGYLPVFYGAIPKNYKNVKLGTYCGYKLPPSIRYKKMITVVFKTDRWVNRRGFRLKYHVDSCGGTITSETEISSPVDDIQSKYHGALNCIWNVTAPVNQYVVIRFTKFELEYSSNCIYDSLKIYNGNIIEDNNRLANLCGNITAVLPVIHSTSRSMIVNMKTDNSNNFKGFKAFVLFSYGENVGCGGTVNLTHEQSVKKIVSPDVDKSGQYVGNLDCHWLVITSINDIIELTFESVHLEPCTNVTEGQKCTCDYLEIRDGGGSLSELIVQPCGHSLPPKITSSSNQLSIRMVTDGVGSSTGFRLSVRRVASPCGSRLLQVTNDLKVLNSPNYPNEYPNNIRCSWLMYSNSTMQKFDMHFKHLELQESTADNVCDTDRLELYDKSMSNYIDTKHGKDFTFSGRKNYISVYGIKVPPTTQVFCGSGKPMNYYSGTNEVSINFITDGSITKKGFSIEYRLAGCNRNFTYGQGRISSENVKNDCIITITVAENNTISLYFQSFLLVGSQECQTSRLEVFDGPTELSTRISKVCGYQLPSPIFSTGNQLLLHFYSNRKWVAGFYDIFYTSTDKGRGCGGDIHNYAGRFTSPLYPNNYRNNTVCRWDITVPIGLQVALKFIVFDIGSVTTCDSDYLQLVDTDSVTNTETVRTVYCGGDTPALFRSTKNSMAVIYTSSVNNGGTGWIASFVGRSADSAIDNTFSFK